MQFRLHPEIGTASDLAKPRRPAAATARRGVANREPSSSYARTSLISHLALRDPILFTFVTDVIRTLPAAPSCAYRAAYAPRAAARGAAAAVGAAPPPRVVRLPASVP